MQAEPREQAQVLQLAELDAHVGRITHSARTLPQHRRIEELMKQRQDAIDALVASETRVSDLEAAVRRSEADLVPVRERLSRNQKRIDDGSVTDGKTLRGLIEEVEHLGRRIGDLEDAELELMEQLETAQSEREQASHRRSEVDTLLRDEVAERDKQVQGLAAQAKELQAERASKLGGVPQPLLDLYEKLRAATGAGAAELKQGRCTGCQLQIPVSDLDGYRKSAPNQVLRCVECDRILVRTAHSGL